MFKVSSILIAVFVAFSSSIEALNFRQEVPEEKRQEIFSEIIKYFTSTPALTFSAKDTDRARDKTQNFLSFLNKFNKFFEPCSMSIPVSHFIFVDFLINSVSRDEELKNIVDSVQSNPTTPAFKAPDKMFEPEAPQSQSQILTMMAIKTIWESGFCNQLVLIAAKDIDLSKPISDQDLNAIKLRLQRMLIENMIFKPQFN